MARELNIRLEAENSLPLYRQIYTYIRDEIRAGSLESGERIPSTRTLAAGLRVARSTVELAYSQLLSEGYIRAKKNSGYYVNEIENLSELHFEGLEPGQGEEVHPAALTQLGKYYSAAADTGAGAETGAGSGTEMIDFSLRHTEMSAFPYSTWKRIMREVMVDANSEMFSHSEPGGDLPLRTTIARYLHFSRGVRCRPEQVIVGAGNDYLLMLLRHILGEGRSVAMENPSYLRAAQIFASFGYRLCPVRMDEGGMMPESVASSGADLVYAMPAHQFPMGCVMPVARRAALLGWAMEAADRYIIEDDYDSEFRYRGKPIPALQSLDHAGRVIYIGTFSKAIAPAIRISYMILPPSLLERYRDKCWFFSSTVSRIDQRILNEFMKNGHFERHLNRMRSLYRARHDELLAQLRQYDLFRDRFRILGGGAGLHLVLETLPGTWTEAAAAEDIPGCRTNRDVPAKGKKSGTSGNAGDGSGKEKGIPCAQAALREQELARRAREHGVVVYCMSDYLLPVSDGEIEVGIPAVNVQNSLIKPAPETEDGPMKTAAEKKDGFMKPAFLLGFGALGEDRIREGVRRLYEAWSK